MKLSKSLFAAAALLAASGAFAQAVGSAGGLTNSANFLDLSTATVSGGATYFANALPNAAIPFNTVGPITTVGAWLAAGPGNNGDATLTLPGGTTYVSFLWGSPDPIGWNTLTVNTDTGSSVFTASGLGILPTPNGDQQFASYVNFTPTGSATKITSLTFGANQNAFEISNVTAVPEPETYALMLAGLAAVGFFVRRRSA